MKIAIRRPGKPGAGSSVDDTPGSGTASAVLDAPEQTCAPETERVPNWPGGGAAPAGALQRGFGPDAPIDAHDDEFGALPSPEQEPYVPRRGTSGAGWFRLRGSLGGRIVLGCAVFLVFGAVAGAIAAARYFLLHDDRFLLAGSAQIQITGAAHLTRAQVLSVFGADLERNIFRIGLAERRADLERLPWVEHATVMRLLPNRIRVAITERTPVAFVRQGTQIGLVDAGGVILDMPPQDAGDPRYSFPVLTGLSANDPLPARAARMEVYRRFIQDIDSNGQHLSNQLSEVDVSNPEDIKALVASGGTDLLVHFGDQDFLPRFQEFQQHLAEWKQQYPRLASADMRYEGQVVLEMQQGAGVPVNEAAAGDASPALAGTTADPPPAAKEDSQKANSSDRRRPSAGTTTNKAKAKVTASKPAAKKPAEAKGVAKTAAKTVTRTAAKSPAKTVAKNAKTSAGGAE